MSKTAPPLGSTSQICFFAPAFAQQDTSHLPPYPNLALCCTAPHQSHGLEPAGPQSLEDGGGSWELGELEGLGSHIQAGRCCQPGGREEAAKAVAWVSNSFLIHFPSEVVLRKCDI